MKNRIFEFIGLLVVGSSALIFTSGEGPIFEFLPALIAAVAVIFYTVLLGIDSSKRQLSGTEVDSVYYLGFSYTLIAMLVSLIGFRNGIEADFLKVVVPKFGVSLVGTVAGLLGRMILAQMAEKSGPDPVWEIGELVEKLSRFNAQVELTTQNLASTVEEVSKIINDSAKGIGIKTNSILTEFAESTVNSMGRIEQACNSLDLNQFRAQVDLLGPAIQMLNSELSQATGASNAVKEGIRTLDASVTMTDQLLLKSAEVFAAQERSVKLAEELAGIQREIADESKAVLKIYLDGADSLDGAIPSSARTSKQFEERPKDKGVLRRLYEMPYNLAKGIFH